MIFRKSAVSVTDGRLVPNILLFAIPIVLTTILQSLYNSADMIVVGQYCGTLAAASISATTIVTSLFLSSFIGLSTGANVIVAYYIGADDGIGTRKAVQTSVWSGLLLGLLLCVIGETTSAPLLRLTGCPADSFNGANLYMRIIYAGVPGSMVYNFGASVLRAKGDSTRPLIFLMSTGLLNVVLNIIMVVPFGLGVAGVALATVVSNYVSAILVIIALARENGDCRFYPRHFELDVRKLGRILSLGIPVALNSMLYSISNLQIQSAINSFGSFATAGNGAASSIEGFVYSIDIAFNGAALTFVSQNRGAGKPDRIRKTMLYCCIMGFAAGEVLGFLVWLAGKPPISLFVGDSAAAVEIGFLRMTHLLLLYGVACLKDVLDHGSRGLGYSVAPTAISLVFVVVWRFLWMAFIYNPHFASADAMTAIRNLYICYDFSWSATCLGQFVCYLVCAKLALGGKNMKK